MAYSVGPNDYQKPYNAEQRAAYAAGVRKGEKNCANGQITTTQTPAERSAAALEAILKVLEWKLYPKENDGGPM